MLLDRDNHFTDEKTESVQAGSVWHNLQTEKLYIQPTSFYSWKLLLSF